MKISIYPSYKKSPFKGNPFINNLYDCFPKEANVHYVYGKNQVGLFHNLFCSKIYIMNWPENVIFDTLGILQVFVFLSFMLLLLLRKAKFVWFFHNITPHEGHNLYSKFMYKFMLKHSSLIVTFSKEGERYLTGRTNAKIKYYPHPFKGNLKRKVLEQKEWDIYIWGSVNKYKGIADFLSFLKQKGLSKYRILITGKCSDALYDTKIRSLLSDNIVYINDYIEMEDIIENIAKSSYVLFPYLHDSVSSSGALMDSLEYGAQVIGPNVGAFKDACSDNLCFAIESYDDIVNIIENRKCIDFNQISEFISNNTWDKFGNNIYIDLNKLG